MTSVSWSGVRSPVWWACLAVLLVNDHVLKGSGLLPGWVTGKLSDFAGLVVAPVVLCAFGRRSVAPRVAAFALVVLPFVGMKLSEAVARAVERAAQSLGLSWRVWVDPTDLLALVVLPVAWRLTTPDFEATTGRPRARFPLERLAVPLGAIACLASSGVSEGYMTRIFLLNVSHRTTEMQIFRSRAPLACDVSPGESIGAAVLVLERCAPAMPFRPLPLDHDYLTVSDGDVEEPDPEAEPKPPRECDAVVLRTPGLADTVVYWREGTDKREVADEVGLGRNEGVFLESSGSGWVLTPSMDSRAWAYRGVLPEVPCVAPR